MSNLTRTIYLTPAKLRLCQDFRSDSTLISPTLKHGRGTSYITWDSYQVTGEMPLKCNQSKIFTRHLET
jgi:hypothetical protein